jgi:hypothetical protein
MWTPISCWISLHVLLRCSHLDKHNRLTGSNIEKDRIELWEESKDGSGKLGWLKFIDLY